MEVVVGIILFILIACILMVATNVLFDFFSDTVIILAVFLLAFGVFFGFGVALNNTAKVYRDIYRSKDGR